MEFPWSYGAGIAYRANDAISFSLDWMRVEWGDFLLKSEGRTYTPITGRPTDAPGFVEPEATNTFRFGGEYLFITEKHVVPIRAGFFYDPQPSEGEPDDFFGLSFGSGLGLRDVTFDFAYQYRFGNRVSPTVS